MPVAYLWKVSESLHNNLYSNLDSSFSSFDEAMMFCDTVWPYVLPPLFALALEAPLSQRTWMAIQKTPILASASTIQHTSRIKSLFQKSCKYGWTHIAPVYFLFISLIATFLQCVAHISPEKAHIFEGIAFGPLFVLATTKLFGLLSGAYALSVRRDAEGDPYVVRNLRPNIPRLFAIAPVLISFFITHRAILYDNRVCKAVIHTALLHTLISADVRSTKSMRAIGTYAVTNVAALVLLIIFLASRLDDIKAFIYQSSEYPAWDEFNRNYLLITKRNFADLSTFRWLLFALSVLWNIFLVEFITLCYRFDFALFARQQGLRPNLDSLYGKEEPLYDANRKPSLTHDMLLIAEMDKEGYNAANIGPIFLAPEASDSFYSYTSPSATSASEYQSGRKETPLPSSLLNTSPIVLPAYFISLGTYVISTLIPLALLYFGITDSDKNTSEMLITYLAPLLPLVTLPITTAFVFICFIFAGDEGSRARELRKYTESWGPEAEAEVEVGIASILEDGGDSP